ncbi:MAG: phosphatidylglycerol lysyltransferase domain-containing protein, partial [Gammaproteobacteria bacterium]
MPPAVTLAIFALVLLALDRELREYHLRDVLDALRSIPAPAMWTAAGLTALSYGSLTLFDVLGLRYAGKSLPYSQSAPTSFIAYAFAHSFSLAALTGAAIRYRLYAPSGLTAVDVARVAAFTSVTTGLGISLLGGLALVSSPLLTGSVLGLGPNWAFALGAAILAGVLAYAAWGILSRKPVELWSWRVEPPGARLVGPQLLVGLADLGFSAAALWVLLPDSVSVTFVGFCAAYAAAIIVTLITHVPGGLGVLESVLMLTVPHGDPAGMFGALLAYRLIYYLLPLVGAAILFAAKELAGQFAVHGRRVVRAASWLQQGSPQLLGSLVFLAGALLLVSGATPGVDSRIAILGDVLPLPILETSHLAGRVIGLALLVLARALFQRVNAAYHLTVLLLLGGVVASLLKGLDYEEALVLGLILMCLWLGRQQFYRQASLWEERFSPAWAVNLCIVIGTAIWIGFLTQKHVPYSNDLWWTFATDADAPRMLRASLLVALLAAAAMLAGLLKPAQPEPVLPTAADLERAFRVIARSTCAGANVALSGDKHLLFATGDAAFLMYRIAGRSWIALGDPVGPREFWEELVWHFREMVDEHGGRTVFYEVAGDSLPLYLDLGLTLRLVHESCGDAV